MLFNFFKNRKSRKQLLEEIEKLKAEKMMCCNSLEIYKETYPIIKISTCCVSSYDANYESIKQCICSDLATQLMPYVQFEKYKMADSVFIDNKHIGTIQIIGNKQGETE